MKYRGYIALLLMLIVPKTYAQIISKDTLPRLDLSKIAHINQADSFITFPADIGNIEPLMFEANINPDFVVREHENSRLMMVLTPQITIRMYNEFSYPVKTPSYIPQLSFYYLIGKTEDLRHLTVFGRLAHHSNGQNGDFYNKDGSINLDSGNFSTNFFEIGYIATSYSLGLKAVKFFKSSLEVHPKNWMYEEQVGQYSGLRWNNSFTVYKLPWDRSVFKKMRRANFSLKVETTWMLDQINNWSTFDTNRFSGALTLYYHPRFLEDIGFFVKFYHGQDYYNIYFRHRLSIIRLGIMTEILRF